MRTKQCGNVILNDFEPAPASFEVEFMAGLRRRPKVLPCKFLYDERGSRLFDRICTLPEYYPTRTETTILRENVGEIAELCGPGSMLVELGSGSSTKTRLLLDHLEAPAAYVPIDISRPHLLRAAEVLNGDYFPLEILPVCADYNQPLMLPSPGRSPRRTVLFFPGSTIGNFEPRQAADFLRRIARWCQPGDALVVGVDMHKNRQILEAAYSDRAGVTAAFNLNLLRRANHELGANFELQQFRHRAVYDQDQKRIEMHLVSRRSQTVEIGGERIAFDPNEYITTEYSYKYAAKRFEALAQSAGWKLQRTWTDRNRWFSVHLLVALR